MTAAPTAKTKDETMKTNLASTLSALADAFCSRWKREQVIHQPRLLNAALLISLLGPAPVTAQESGRSDGMRFVPDVPGQFDSLTLYADALGFHIGSSPNPSTCRHYQGMARVDAADDTPYLLGQPERQRAGRCPGGVRR
jgi:hypothetical protein